MSDISQIRKEYKLRQLIESDVATMPVDQLNIWIEEAILAKVNEPTAMHLSTVSPEGKPSGRIVLLKGIENNSVIFYTNYDSKKGKEIAANPFAAITFFWPELERQVRIEGKITKVDEPTSDKYFLSRPFPSQVGAVTSPQSQIISGREVLDKKLEENLKLFHDQNVKRPSNWGGYCLNPDYFEFWQGRPGRLHDRISYKSEHEAWKIFRLAP